jgi:hypothetical protein
MGIEAPFGIRRHSSAQTLRMMNWQAPGAFNASQRTRMPNPIPRAHVIADELAGDIITLEGHDLVVVEAGNPTRTRSFAMGRRSDWLLQQPPRPTAFIKCSLTEWHRYAQGVARWAWVAAPAACTWLAATDADLLSAAGVPVAFGFPFAFE